MRKLHLVLAMIFTTRNVFSQVSFLDSTYTLPEVTVIAGAISVDIGAYAKLDSSALAGISGSSLADAMIFIPGALVNVNSKSEGEFSLRGAISRDTKLYIDGRPTASSWEGKMDFSGVPLTAISGLAIIKGPPPLKYGANLGGAVEISTIDPPSKPTTSIALQYGSGEFKRASVLQSLTFPKIAMVGEISAESRMGYPLPAVFQSANFENGGLRDNSDNRRYAGFFKAKFETFRAPTVFTCSYSDEIRGIPPNTEEFPFRWRFKGIDSYYIDLKRTVHTKSENFQSQLYFDGYYNRLKRYTTSNSDYAEANYIYDSVHRSKTLGWNQSGSMKFNPRWNLDWGLMSSYDLFSREEQTPSSGGFSNPIYDHSLRADIYTEAKVKITLLSEASLGLGMENLWREDGKTWNYPIPRIGVSTSPMKDLRLAFNAVRSAQFPTFNHLYSQTSGNPDLKPETAWRGEIGGQYYLNGKMTFSAWHYRSYIQGRIDRQDRSSPYQNFNDAELYGEELTWEYKGDTERISLGITQQNVKITLPAGATFPPLGGQIPPMKIDLNWFKKLSPQWDMTLNASYTAPWDDSEGITVGERTLIDVNSRYRIVAKWNWTASVENLLDQEYYTEYGFPQAGRIWKIGVATFFN